MRPHRSTAVLALLATLAAGAAAAGPGPMGGPMHGRLDAIDFAAIDADGNGSLSRAELQARAAARLGRADANADGALDRDEIIVALSPPGAQLFEVFSTTPAEAMADRILAMAGATETGRVEVAVIADRRVNMLLARADTDRDAAISAEEAEAIGERPRGGRDHRGHGRRGHGPGGPEEFGMAPDAPQPPRGAPEPAAPATPRG